MPDSDVLRRAKEDVAAAALREHELAAQLVQCFLTSAADHAKLTALVGAWRDAESDLLEARYSLFAAENPGSFPSISGVWSAAAWIATAATTGVIGNVAYGTLKQIQSALVKGVLQRRQRGGPIDEGTAVLIARLAASARLRDLNWSEPSDVVVPLTECDNLGNWTVRLSYSHDSLEAVVSIPASVRDTDQLSVLLRKAVAG